RRRGARGDSGARGRGGSQPRRALDLSLAPLKTARAAPGSGVPVRRGGHAGRKLRPERGAGCSRRRGGRRLVIHIIWSLVVGFFAGLLARPLMRGADHIGLLATSLLGILG